MIQAIDNTQVPLFQAGRPREFFPTFLTRVQLAEMEAGLETDGFVV
jgi:hypothetical protein